MKWKMAFAILVITALLAGVTSVLTVSAETNPTLPQAPGRLDGTGTHFALTGSDYLNVTLDSSEPINLVLESVPQMVTLHVESASGASSTQITLGGFLPSTTYYQYQDDYHNRAAFTTDASGTYTFTQELSSPHLVFIQSKPSTKFINDSSTGGDCTLVGTWDPATKTCTLTTDVYETIQIDSDGITLDGNGRTITGTGGAYGVYLYWRNGVTLKNLNAQNFTYGIYLYRSDENTLTNNRSTVGLAYSSYNTITASTAASGYFGVYFSSSHHNKLTGSTVTSNMSHGVTLFLADYNILTDNNLNSNGYGIYTALSGGTTIARNTIASNGYYGIFFYSSGAQVYNNNFINNPVQAVDLYGGSHVLNLAAPIGGNYWSNYDTSAEGCNDLNGDGFCDASYFFTGGQDNLPWTRKDGWANRPPTANAGGPYNVSEGDSITLNASGSDLDGDPLTYAWDINNDGTFETPGQSVTFSAATLDGPATPMVAVQVTDSGGLTATAQATISILNVAPTVGPITAPLDPVPVNTSINASASFADPGVLDTHTAVWNWGDNTTSPGTISESNGSGTIGGSHAYASAGVYSLTLTVTDKDGASGSSSFQYVVVYDPNGGFVTGGGTIDSPSGAYVPNPSLVGKANFGFVAKYQQGATTPVGNTQFSFQMANLSFKSTSYDWLVVAGAKGQFKGSGAINGGGDYGFLLTSIDGQVNGGGGIDKFRIKIWDRTTGNVIYDNQVGATDTSDTADPVTAITAGSIVVQK